GRHPLLITASTASPQAWTGGALGRPSARTARLSVRPATMSRMTTSTPLTQFQWLNVSESSGGGELGVIFSVAFFRGLDPAEVVRRFSRGESSGQESDFGGLE